MRLSTTLLALGLAATSACGGASSTARTGSPTHTLNGTVTWYDAPASAQGCASGGSNSYDDLLPGGQVTVFDGTGRLLGIGILTGPRPGRNSLECQLGFTVPHVASAASYGIEVTHRGTVSFGDGTLAAQGWDVALSIVSGFASPAPPADRG